MNVSISSVSGQSSDNWQTVRDVLHNPDSFSNSRNIDAIIEKLDMNISSNCMSKWDIDQSVFYEMEDTAETYRIITSEKDKSDLDTSIRNLIELG